MTPRVPLELISLIIDHLASDEHPSTKTALKSCTLAARLFVPLCQPYLFHTISIYEHYSDVYKYKDWTDILTRNPTICNYIREIKICLLDSHRDADAHHMEALFPAFLESLSGVYSVVVIPRTWNVGSKMEAVLRQLFASPTLHTLRVENSSFISPDFLSRITHVKHLSFDNVCREDFLFSSRADPIPHASRVRLESLSITNCGSTVTNFLRRTVTSWDFSGLKYLKLGLNQDHHSSSVAYSAWNFVYNVAERIEELTIVIYSVANVHNPLNLSFFHNLRLLTLDLNFTWKEPEGDLICRIITPFLHSRSPPSTLERIRIFSPVLAMGSPKQIFTADDWRLLNTTLSANMEVHSSLQLPLEIGFRRVVSDSLVVQMELISAVSQMRVGHDSKSFANVTSW